METSFHFLLGFPVHLVPNVSAYSTIKEQAKPHKHTHKHRKISLYDMTDTACLFLCFSLLMLLHLVSMSIHHLPPEFVKHMIQQTLGKPVK